MSIRRASKGSNIMLMDLATCSLFQWQLIVDSFFCQNILLAEPFVFCVIALLIEASIERVCVCLFCTGRSDRQWAGGSR